MQAQGVSALLADVRASATLAKVAAAISDRAGLSKLESMFDDFDTDNSGELDVEEFEAALKQFGAHLEQEEVRITRENTC
jgi:Ca2+-binding EF-hand superfamily protein